jgi:hypothetical protein
MTNSSTHFNQDNAYTDFYSAGCEDCEDGQDGQDLTLPSRGTNFTQELNAILKEEVSEEPEKMTEEELVELGEELEEELNALEGEEEIEGDENSTFDATAASDAFSSDSILDDLLADSMQQVAGKIKLKVDRKRLLDTRVMGTERQEIEESIKRWELAREWVAVANVAMFNTQYWSHCASIHNTFSGLFQRQLHRTSKVNRWQAVVAQEIGLKYETMHTEAEVAICAECVGEQGFAPEQGYSSTPGLPLFY